MKKRFAILVTLALAGSAVFTDAHRARAQRPAPTTKKTGDPLKDSSVWMKHKLVASQNILEGMTRGDYSQIAKNAQAMQDVTYLEGWVRADVPGYKTQLHVFNFSNGAIVTAAHEKNMDGVTLAYTQLTISCVQCHKIVRDKAKD